MITNRLLDLTPLRTSRDFRLSVAAGTVTYLGGMMTYVAVPFQVYRLTGSNTAVGAIGLVELVPLVVFGLYGGVLADRHDRRRILVAATAAQALLTAGLLANALVGTRSWAPYLLAGLLAAAQAVQRPSGEALVPRVVRHEEIPAAALPSIGPQVGMLVGPAIRGLLLAGPGASWCYAVDAAGLAAATCLFAALRPQPPGVEGERPSLAGVVDGLRYAVGRRDLLGTYLVDLKRSAGRDRAAVLQRRPARRSDPGRAGRGRRRGASRDRQRRPAVRGRGGRDGRGVAHPVELRRPHRRARGAGTGAAAGTGLTIPRYPQRLTAATRVRLPRWPGRGPGQAPGGARQQARREQRDPARPQQRDHQSGEHRPPRPPAGPRHGSSHRTATGPGARRPAGPAAAAPPRPWPARTRSAVGPGPAPVRRAGTPPGRRPG
jgi:hypothetical protein